MMDLSIIFKIVAIGFLTAISSMLLKKANKDDVANIVSIVGLILCIVLLIDMVAQLYSTIQSLFEF